MFRPPDDEDKEEGGEDKEEGGENKEVGGEDKEDVFTPGSGGLGSAAMAA